MAKLKKKDTPKVSFKEKILNNHLIKHILAFTSNIGKDKLTAFSSEAALFTIISFFPFLMLFFYILSFTPLTPAFIIRLIDDSFPSEIIELIMTVVVQLNNTSTTVVSFTILAAIWSASRGFVAIVNGLNVIYEVKDKRNIIFHRLYGLIYTLGFAVLLFVTLILLGFGNSIYVTIIKHFPFIKDLAILIMGLRVIVLLTLLFFFFLIMYMVLPNRKSHLLNEMPGAFLSACGWVVFSYAFAFYIDNIANFSIIYGSLTTIVLLLLWVYSCMLILFLGAELNYYVHNYVEARIACYGTNSKFYKMKQFISAHNLSISRSKKRAILSNEALEDIATQNDTIKSDGDNDNANEPTKSNKIKHKTNKTNKTNNS